MGDRIIGNDQGEEERISVRCGALGPQACLHPTSQPAGGGSKSDLRMHLVSQVYNGVADVTAGSEFHVAPPSWGLGRSSPGAEDRVSFKVTFPVAGGPRFGKGFKDICLTIDLQAETGGDCSEWKVPQVPRPWRPHHLSW